MNRIRIGFLSALLPVCVVLMPALQAQDDMFGDASAENSGAGRTASARNGRRNTNRWGIRRNADQEAWAKAQKELRKKNPKACEEIDKLAKNNLVSAMMKMSELMRKEKIEIPGRNGGEQGPRGGFPTQGGGHGGFQGMRNWNFPSGSASSGEREKALESVKAKFPAEYIEYEKLLEQAKTGERETNRIRLEAEKKAGELAKKAKVTLPENFESYFLKTRYLQEKYKKDFENAEGRESREKLLAELAKKENLILGERPGFRFGNSAFGFQPGRKNGETPDSVGKTAKRTDPLAVMRQLRRDFPEEMKKIDALRAEDPAKAREKLKELLRKHSENQEKKQRTKK